MRPSLLATTSFFGRGGQRHLLTSSSSSLSILATLQATSMRFNATATAASSSPSTTTTPSSPSTSSTTPPAASMYKTTSSRSRGGARGASSLPPSNKNNNTTATTGASPMTASAGGGISNASKTKKTMDASDPSAAALSCADEKPAEERPLTALQKRQLAMKDKKVFKLTSRAVDRVNLLLNLHNDRIDPAAAVAAAASNGGSSSDNNSDKNKRAVGIRIGVKKKGCSGYSYTVNYEFDEKKLLLKTGGDALIDAMLNGTRAAASNNGTPSSSAAGGGGGKISLFANNLATNGNASSSQQQSHPTDVHVDQDGVHIFVEGSALFYVIGTVMDYTISNVEEKFTFQNPNQAHSCGCGESFMPFGV